MEHKTNETLTESASTLEKMDEEYSRKLRNINQAITAFERTASPKGLKALFPGLGSKKPR